jgi:Flp pilus assembly protein TadD/4-amino-4-deoxy-L-arabinose transferase-like glycosyltransferase
MMERREKIILAIITTLGFALRLIYLFTMKSNWPGFDTPTIDALYHHLWAQKIVSGDILSGGPFFRAPLYPYLLAAVYSILGTNFLLVFLIQNILGTAAIILVYLICREFFRPSIGYIAAILTAINGVAIFFECQLLLDFLLIDFILFIIYFLLAAARKGSSLYYLSAGISIGLFAITRPNILAVIPLIILWIFLMRNPAKSSIKYSTILLAGAALIILPITARNVFIGHDVVLIASQGGINFYIGNNEKADGYTALLPGKGHTWQYSDAEYDAAIELGVKPGTLKPSQVSDFYYNKSLKFILGSPWRFIKLQIKKLYLFWNYFEISNNNSLFFITRYIGLGFYPIYLFAIIGPIGLVGAIALFKRNRRLWLIPFMIFGYMLTVIAYFVTDRFRLPILPLLSISTAYVLCEIFDAIKDKKYRRGLAYAGAILSAGVFCWSNFYGHHDKSNAQAYYSLGNIFLKKGNYEQAKRQYLQAASLGKCVPHAHTNLGVIAFYEGDTATARQEFEKEIACCGPSGKAYNNRSLLKRLGGDFKAAYAIADTAATLFPNYKEPYINRILAAFGTDEHNLIEQSCRKIIEVFPDDIGARYYYGMYLIREGLSDSAEINFRYAITSTEQDIVAEYDLSDFYSAGLPYGYNPQKIRGRCYYQLGLLSVRKGELLQALAYFNKAVALNPDDADAIADLALAYDQTGKLQDAKATFEKAIALDSNNALYYYNYALTLGKLRDLQNSEKALAKAVELYPDFETAKAKLKALREYLNINQNQ